MLDVITPISRAVPVLWLTVTEECEIETDNDGVYPVAPDVVELDIGPEGRGTMIARLPLTRYFVGKGKPPGVSPTRFIVYEILRRDPQNARHLACRVVADFKVRSQKMLRGDVDSMLGVE